MCWTPGGVSPALLCRPVSTTLYLKMNHHPTQRLKWHWDEEGMCHRAYDKYAMYVITGDEVNGYQITVISGADAISAWRESIPTLAQAKLEAEKCVDEVKKIRKSMGYDYE